MAAVDVDDGDMPLLWVLRDDHGIVGFFGHLMEYALGPLGRACRLLAYQRTLGNPPIPFDRNML